MLDILCFLRVILQIRDPVKLSFDQSIQWCLEARYAPVLLITSFYYIVFFRLTDKGKRKLVFRRKTDQFASVIEN